jgi:hypothetical protein
MNSNRVTIGPPERPHVEMVVLNGRSALLPYGLPVYRNQHAVARLDEFLRANRQGLEVFELQAHVSRDFGRSDVTPRLRAPWVHDADGVCVEQLASSPEVPAPPLAVDGAEGIHVLLRHRLLPQPGGFEDP